MASILHIVDLDSLDRLLEVATRHSVFDPSTRNDWFLALSCAEKIAREHTHDYDAAKAWALERSENWPKFNEQSFLETWDSIATHRRRLRGPGELIARLKKKGVPWFDEVFPDKIERLLHAFEVYRDAFLDGRTPEDKCLYFIKKGLNNPYTDFAILPNEPEKAYVRYCIIGTNTPSAIQEIDSDGNKRILGSLPFSVESFIG